MPKIQVSNYDEFAESAALNDLFETVVEEVKDKVRQKLDEGKSGWDEPSDENYDYLKGCLEEELGKGEGTDFVDVIAYAGFLWNIKDDVDR